MDVYVDAFILILMDFINSLLSLLDFFLLIHFVLFCGACIEAVFMMLIDEKVVLFIGYLFNVVCCDLI